MLTILTDYSILNCEKRDGSTLAVASEALSVKGNAVSGVSLRSKAASR